MPGAPVEEGIEASTEEELEDENVPADMAFMATPWDDKDREHVEEATPTSSPAGSQLGSVVVPPLYLFSLFGLVYTRYAEEPPKKAQCKKHWRESWSGWEAAYKHANEVVAGLLASKPRTASKRECMRPRTKACLAAQSPQALASTATDRSGPSRACPGLRSLSTITDPPRALGRQAPESSRITDPPEVISAPACGSAR